MIIAYALHVIISMFKISMMGQRNWIGMSICAILGLVVSAYLFGALVYGNIVLYVDLQIDYIDPALYGMTVYFVVYGYFEMIIFFLVFMILITSLCVEKNPNAGAGVMLPNSNTAHAIVAVLRADKG